MADLRLNRLQYAIFLCTFTICLFMLKGYTQTHRQTFVHFQIMKCSLTFLFHLLFAISVNAEEHPLHRRLSTWHILRGQDLQFHRHKRSTLSETVLQTLDKEISFNAFDKTFVLSLTPSPDVFASGFKAYVQSQTTSSSVDIDKGSVYKGNVLGDSKSEVTAHLNDRVLTANIITNNETYIVEPLWRHLPIPQASRSKETPSNEKDMIVYRESDVNLAHLQHPHAEKGFCNTNKLMREFRKKQGKSNKNKTEPSQDFVEAHHRTKRASTVPLKKICKLSLVADFRFYRHMGNSSVLETMYYLISLIERVNKIYRNTIWDASNDDSAASYTGYHFQLGQIIVHNESSIDKPSYNKDRIWNAKDLLEAFSEKNLSECLSHLFTYVDFDQGLLGLAYVGSERKEDIGGICTKRYDKGGGQTPLYLNTGLTSTVNWGQKILTTEADLVTAHELGHNFGAEHDVEQNDFSVDNCRPGQANGGNYIMNPAAVSGRYPNNKLFSACSKRNILPSLKNKAPLCFQEEKNSFCGNYQVERHDNETCDVGYITGVSNEDPCCFSNCTLRPHAKCSNKNYPCCTESCQVATVSKMCRAGIQGLCKEDSYCDGKSFSCPEAKSKPDDTECGDKGQCKSGVCEPFCKTKGMQPCLCTSNKEDYCKRCCAPLNVTGSNMTELCKPYTDLANPQTQQLPDNSTCAVGYCKKGVCNKQTQDVIERVWDIFKHIAPDKIGEFLADNIVGAVLVFSLLFWIPCSCLVNFVDKKRLKERQKEERWRTDRGAEYSRQSAFRGIGTGSAPATPRMRIQRNNANWNSGAVLRSGFGARDQWRASQERGIAARKSQENLKVLVVSSNGNSAQPNSQYVSAEPTFFRPAAMKHAHSHPSLSPSLDDKSFDGEVGPIAASSTTDLPAAVMKETSTVSQAPPPGARGQKVLHRQAAVSSPVELKDTTV